MGASGGSGVVEGDKERSVGRSRRGLQAVGRHTGFVRHSTRPAPTRIVAVLVVLARSPSDRCAVRFIPPNFSGNPCVPCHKGNGSDARVREQGDREKRRGFSRSAAIAAATALSRPVRDTVLSTSSCSRVASPRVGAFDGQCWKRQEGKTGILRLSWRLSWPFVCRLELRRLSATR